MSLLSYVELRALQDSGVITNSLSEHVNSSSIDITLGSDLLVEPFTGFYNVALQKRDSLHMRPVTLGPKGYTLYPGAFILAQSEQLFNLPNELSCEYKLKSSLARIGLEHMNAGWCDAGWNGSVLTLEFKNVTQRHSITVQRGDRVGQVVFFRHASVPAEASYSVRGRYNGDRSVSGVKL